MVARFVWFDAVSERWFQRKRNAGSRRLIRGKYICTRHVLSRKSINPGLLEYVYAERGSARFQVTQKRLTKIFKRDGPGFRAARGCLFAFVASRDNGKRKPDASPSSSSSYSRRSFPFFHFTTLCAIENRANSLFLYIFSSPLPFFFLNDRSSWFLRLNI